MNGRARMTAGNWGALLNMYYYVVVPLIVNIGTYLEILKMKLVQGSCIINMTFSLSFKDVLGEEIPKRK